MSNMEESPNMESTTAGEKKPSAFSRFVKKHPVFMTILCGLLVVVVVYFWKEVEGNMKRKAVVEAATTQLQETNKNLLMLFCKPLVWNVRSEMLRGNMEQVNLLISDLVKEKHFQYIQLVKQDGIVFLSTNKKMEGQPIENENLKNALSSDSTVVIQEEGNLILLVSPVMGYDKKLATLVVSYLPESFTTDINLK